MSSAPPEFSSAGFVKTVVLPGLLVFPLPTVSLFFFLYAQRSFNADARKIILEQVRADETLSPAEREVTVAFYTLNPMSELLKSPDFADMVDGKTRFDYATFRWAIRLSLASIASGILVFALAGVCVWWSRRSQRAQYLSLLIGGQVVRIYAALQTIVQGALLVALSYWVTALLFNIYVPKLILIVALLALTGVGAILKAIFKRPDNRLAVEGLELDRQAAPRLWSELDALCAQVETAPPDHVIVGIDDNFFVTEAPVTVGERTLHGRTLFASLALLKQMSGAEADGVLAHEMAHFSGQDTVYTKKINPLLQRDALYLQALHENPLTWPVYYFMLCFRALFELTLGERSRLREFRADRIAAEATTPRDFARALVRISAYSDYRRNVQEELFKQERAMETANICGQIEAGFHQYAVSFAAKPDLETLATSHPFDSHPPMSQRLEALGVSLQSQEAQSLVANPGDGRWYRTIDRADEIERAQWDEYEERFRHIHEQSLPYRFLPETDEEREIVEQAFPPLVIEGKKGSLMLDCETIQYSPWPGSLAYSEITNCVLNDGALEIHYEREGKQHVTIPLKKFGKHQAEALQAISNYYGRYAAAKEYQQHKQDQPPTTGE
ncbi:MAG: M48 family metalloprotease [Pirellulales bacterium]|nr:M48 family metalloprotease [Pirellulales bacterium]